MNKIIQGNCLEKLKELPDNSIDSIVTDPPYELGFMGKSWDNTGIANNPLMWAECLRVLKPGGHLLSFGGTRTYHRMAVAIEDAGFEVRDMIEWCYGSGFPKSLNIGKAVDKIQGNEREQTGISDSKGIRSGANNIVGDDYGKQEYPITKGTSEWEGWGTALKPAHEPICMARKPLAEKTVAENCLKYGTGGINIDESRVGTDNITINGGGKKWRNNGAFTEEVEPINEERTGRFPANLIHDGSDEVVGLFPNTKSGSMNGTYKNTMMKGTPGERDGKEIHLQQQASEGSASRFFYCAKASKSERNRGCEGLEEKVRISQGLAGEHKDTVSSNSHPTVKPIALMEYLIKMVTPKGGTVLDPFAGSGSTLVAAKQNGFNYVGIEMTEEYLPIINARLGL